MTILRAIRVIPGTKISHDYNGDDVKTFDYLDLYNRNIEAVGIPCRQNNLFVIDVDVPGTSHKEDGRPFWAKLTAELDLPPTYTVTTPSGGYHFYYRLPEAINPDTFSPPAKLAPGVDIKWNGWVAAPPTPHYVPVNGPTENIQYAPGNLLKFMAELKNGAEPKTFDHDDLLEQVAKNKPYTDDQIKIIRDRIRFIQENVNLSRDEWRDGLFSLKAGVEDPALLDELAVQWTMNRAYVPGDEEQARSIIERADKYGPIGPGTFLEMTAAITRRETPVAAGIPFTIQEIFDRAKITPEYGKDGKLRMEPTESNAAQLIGAIYPADVLYHDERLDLYMFQGKSYSDEQLVNIFLPMLQSPKFGMGIEKFRKPQVRAGLDVLMAARKRDPHREYLKSVKWDGKERIERFFVTHVGATDSEYIRKVGLNFWTSLAARGLRPGCKLDSMVILEGHQGIMKSSLVQAIGGEYTFTPSQKDALDNLEELRKMHQSVIVELPELLGIVRMDAETIKAFLAKPFDHIRSLFARKAMKHERGFVFVGTTNSDKYLPQGVGSRRFWPVRIPHGKHVDLNAVRADRDQLFAEAVQRYLDGYPYWEMPAEMLDEVVTRRVVTESLTHPIAEMLPLMGAMFSTMDVYRRLEAAGYVARGYNSALMNRIENALNTLGCEMTGDQAAGGFLWRVRSNIVNAFENIPSPSMSLDSLI